MNARFNGFLEFLDLLHAVATRQVDQVVEILLGWSEGEADLDLAQGAEVGDGVLAGGGVDGGCGEPGADPVAGPEGETRGGQRVARQRSGRQHGRAVGHARDLFAHDLNARMGLKPGRHRRREADCRTGQAGAARGQGSRRRGRTGNPGRGRC